MIVFNPLTSAFDMIPSNLTLNWLTVGGTRALTDVYAGLPAASVFVSDGYTLWQTAYVDSTAGADYAAALSVFPDAKSGGGTIGVTSFFGGYQGELSFGFFPSDAADAKANSLAIFTGTGGSLLPFNDATTDLGRSSYRWKNGYFSGYHEMVEMTAPSAGAANTARIYAEDNGAGKTRLMVQFPTGAAVQLAIEP